MARMSRGKRSGWWSNPSYTIEDAIHRSNLSPKEWDKFDWYERARRIAYLRAVDTMQAWESIPDEDKKKWRMVILSESASKP